MYNLKGEKNKLILCCPKKRKGNNEGWKKHNPSGNKKNRGAPCPVTYVFTSAAGC